MNHPKTVAYGEIGLDYHIFEKENYAKPPEQKRIFEIQVQLLLWLTKQMKHAIALKKPIILHTREAGSKTVVSYL